MSEISDAPAVTQPAEFKTTVTSSEIEPKVLPAEGDKKPAADPAPAQGADAPATEVKKEAAPEGEVKADEKSGDELAVAAAKAKREDRQLKNRLFKENAELRARLEAAERARQEAPAPVAAPVQSEAAPDISQFTTTEEYVKAVEAYAAHKITKDRETTEQRARQQATEQFITNNWSQHVAHGEEKYDDFHEKVGALPTNLPWTRAIMVAPNGADVAYYLGTHMDEARQITSLPPDSQGVAIGTLSARIAAEQAKPKVVTQAPEPIKPVTGSTIVRDGAPSDNDDINTWMKKENMRLAKKVQGLNA